MTRCSGWSSISRRNHVRRCRCRADTHVGPVALLRSRLHAARPHLAAVTRRRLLALAGVLLALAPAPSGAQDAPLPRSEAESLIDAGRWTEAEEMLYASARARPRDPIARARLGRYLAMKGALARARARGGSGRVRPCRRRRSRARDADPHAARLARAGGVVGAGLDDRRAAAGGGGRVDAYADHSRHPRGYALGRPGPAGWSRSTARQARLRASASRRSTPRFRRSTWPITCCDCPPIRARRCVPSVAGIPFCGRSVKCAYCSHQVGCVRSPEALRELAPRWWQLDLPHGLLVVR